MSTSNNSIQVKKQQAAGLLESNRPDEAIKILSKLCSRRKKDAEAWNMLGAANSMLELYPEAEKCIRHIIKLSAGNFQAHNNLGSALRAQGKHKEALFQFDKAIQMNTAYALAHFNKGGVLQDLENIDEAVTSFQRASQLAPQDADIHYSLAEAFRETRDLDSALKHYQQALRIKPGLVDAVGKTADIYKARKQYTEAFQLLEPFIQGRPSEIPIDVAVNFALLCRHTGRYDDGIVTLERIKNGVWDTLLVKDRMAVCFALGNLFDARGDYAAAFSNYNIGNQLKAGANNAAESSADEDSRLRATLAFFTTQYFQQAPRANNTSESPVFIIGMPRSGTSLVEQILCSHPAVYGAGELNFLNQAVAALWKMSGSVLPYPEYLKGIKKDHLNNVANNYLDKLHKLSKGKALRITDKMPANYWYLCLIYLLFPKARVIHCMRNPKDTCLSIYFQNFANAHEYTNDLKSIGRVYNIYRQLMSYWQSVLDIPILSVHYEELVSNQEAVTRKLVDYCGLPWNEQCLQHQDNPRMVITASHDQVRRPIYNTSIQRWENYQSFIGPLLAELGDIQENTENAIEPHE